MASPVTSTHTESNPGIFLDNVKGHVNINANTSDNMVLRMQGCAGVFNFKLQGNEPPAKKRKINQITPSAKSDETDLEWIDCNDAPEELLEVLEANKENFAQVVIERPDITIKSNDATYDVSVNGKIYKVFYRLGKFTSFAEFLQEPALN